MEPRIGKNYSATRLFVLGESHYCDKRCSNCGISRAHPECADFTRRVIADYLNPHNEREGWMNTYLKFERSLVGHETTRVESSQIWDDFAFYNYLQVALEAPRLAGKSTQYKQAESAFFPILEELRPQLMIVWGMRLWHKLSYTYWSEGETLIVRTSAIQFEHYEVGYYTLPSGHIVHALGIYHPSGGFSWSYWHDVIEAMKEKIHI